MIDTGETPLVSVCMITYNHGPYIRKAIEGILMQKCPFPFELVIGEDCSMDDTRAICSEYELSDPRIRLLPAESNLGMLPNFFRTIEACSGKYIAFCEGDDFWTDPEKLTRQVEFLENNPGFGMVCTDYKKLFQSSGIVRNRCFTSQGYVSEVFFRDYLTDMSTISTATVMAQRNLVDQYLKETDPALRNRFYVGDSPMWLFIAAKSRIGVLPFETAVYRILDNSACHITSDEKHFSFVMNGLATAEYFLLKYGNAEPSLMTVIERKRHKAALYHAFKTRDKELAKATWREMRKTPAGPRLRLWTMIMLTGASSGMANRLISFFLKLLRQGIGLRKSKE